MTDQPAAEEPERRPGRAVVVLGHITLEELLDLPDGMRIVGISHDFLRLAVLLGVEADWLPPLEQGMTASELGGMFNVETTVDDEGKTWCRWNWGGGKVADG